MGGGGGSFLGTAAAAAAGVVGGSLLLGSIRSMMGGGHQQAFGDTAGPSAAAAEARRPWSDQSGGDLARDAGINDIGSSGSRAADDNDGSRAGLFDQASNDDDIDDQTTIDDDIGSGFATISAAVTATAITPERSCSDSAKQERPLRSSGRFRCRARSNAHQITTTLAPTLTRP